MTQRRRSINIWSLPDNPAKRSQPPIRCKALLLCDRVIVEAGTGKPSIIGVFETLHVRTLPNPREEFTIFLRLANGLGRYEIVVEVVNLGDGKTEARSDSRWIEFSHRLVNVHLVLPLAELPIDREGAYDLIVFTNGDELDRQKFDVQFVADEE